jgi:hypothetical protein
MSRSRLPWGALWLRNFIPAYNVQAVSPKTKSWSPPRSPQRVGTFSNSSQ